jgi:hypothetical protein
VVLPVSLFHVENHVCLFHGVQVTSAVWWAARRIVAGVGDLIKRNRDGCTGRVTPCVVCTVHKETRSADFLVEPQNQGRRFVSGLASKPLGWFLPVWL